MGLSLALSSLSLDYEIGSLFDSVSTAYFSPVSQMPAAGALHALMGFLEALKDLSASVC
jgi:hypothetical protein